MTSPTAKHTSSSATTLSASEFRRIDAVCRASNYLSLGQIDLLDNPRLRKPLAREHVQPRSLALFVGQEIQ